MKKILKQIREKTKSVFFRIILVVILLVVPLNIWSLFTVATMTDYIYAEARDSVFTVGQLLLKELDTRVKSTNYYLYDDLLDNLFFNTMLKEQEDNEYLHAVYNLHTNLQEHITESQDADVYFLYSPKTKTMIFVKSMKWIFSDQETKDYLQTQFTQVKYSPLKGWKLVEEGEKQWLLRCIYKKGIYYGALIDVKQICKEAETNIAFFSSKLWIQEQTDVGIQQFKQIMNEKGNVLNLDTKDQIQTVCLSEQTSFILMASIEKQELVENLPILQRGGVAISVILLVVLPLLVFYLYYLLLRPTRILLKAMDKVQNGNWEYHIQEEANSTEFGRLYCNFNKMIDTQNEMRIKYAEERSYNNELELQNLQMQIRPHLLMNSFKLLYGLVSVQKIESAQRMILYLSEYFRYIFRNGKDMDIYEKELDMILQYIDIAKLRYPFVSFEETHDEDMLQVEVPPLLIHNFVENVLKHGIKTKEMTNIRLSAKRCGEKAYFIISDNGRGMGPRVVELINQRLFESEELKNHVGIRNSWQRIQRYFGSDGDLRVTSVPGKETVVEIEIPCK